MQVDIEQKLHQAQLEYDPTKTKKIIREWMESDVARYRNHLQWVQNTIEQHTVEIVCYQDILKDEPMHQEIETLPLRVALEGSHYHL